MFTHLCHTIVGNLHVTLYVIHTARVIHAVHTFETMSESYMDQSMLGTSGHILQADFAQQVSLSMPGSPSSPAHPME